jgi:hypothetical protein
MLGPPFLADKAIGKIGKTALIFSNGPLKRFLIPEGKLPNGNDRGQRLGDGSTGKTIYGLQDPFSLDQYDIRYENGTFARIIVDKTINAPALRFIVPRQIPDKYVRINGYHRRGHFFDSAKLLARLISLSVWCRFVFKIPLIVRAPAGEFCFLKTIFFFSTAKSITSPYDTFSNALTFLGMVT